MENRRTDIKKNLNAKISSIVSRLKIDEPLKNHTTFRIGGPAEYFIEIQNFYELSKVFKLREEEKIPVLILGSGSNVLISDKGYSGVVIKLSGDFNKFVFKQNSLSVGSGVNLPIVVQEAQRHELSGLEILSGIPGTIGGALITNAGTFDHWIGDVVEEVEVLSDTYEKLTIRKKDLKFGYRTSNLENRIILNAELNLKKGQKNDILNTIKELKLHRQKTQPLGAFCAGSIFKNPKEKSAGFLIEACGLKGLCAGGAKISEKHANFVVNFNKASATDVYSLIKIVREKVKENFGINLDLEIKIIGEIET